MLYYLKFEAALPKIYKFVQHTPLQSAANVRVDEDENPCSSVVAEAMEAPASCSCLPN